MHRCGKVKRAGDGIEVDDKLFELVLIFLPEVDIDKIFQQFLLVIIKTEQILRFIFPGIGVPIDNEVHGPDKGIILLDVEGPYEVALPTEIYDKRDTQVVITEVCLFIKEEVNVTAGVVLVLAELQGDQVLILKLEVVDQIVLAKLLQQPAQSVVFALLDGVVVEPVQGVN